MSVSRSAAFRAILFPLAAVFPADAARALVLTWPAGATLVQQMAPAQGALRVATGPFGDGMIPDLREIGTRAEQVWHIPGEQGDPARLEAHVIDQLLGQGFEVLFTCSDQACGGFDFRHAMPIASGPDMLVDLGHFHYVAALRRDEDGVSLVAVTLSFGGDTGYAHMAYVVPAGQVPPSVTSSTRVPETPAATDDVISALNSVGRAPLDDLRFDTGAATLSEVDYQSLIDLAAFLIDNPARRVLLVGHSDAEGSLSGNIALSRARAEAVRERLLNTHGVAPDQVRAEGIGFMAPRAPNSSPEGREANRRVEVVLTLE